MQPHFSERPRASMMVHKQTISPGVGRGRRRLHPRCLSPQRQLALVWGLRLPKKEPQNPPIRPPERPTNALSSLETTLKASVGSRDLEPLNPEAMSVRAFRVWGSKGLRAYWVLLCLQSAGPKLLTNFRIEVLRTAFFGLFNVPKTMLLSLCIAAGLSIQAPNPNLKP